MHKQYRYALGIALASLYILNCAIFPHEAHFIDLANLIFHEAGHVIFMFFGHFVYVLMGSGFQILLPVCIALYFFYHRQTLSGYITLMWSGESIANVSVYAGDAVTMQLPLLGGDTSGHDWHYLLSTMHLLPYTPTIAGFMYSAGLLVVVASIAFAYTELFTGASSAPK